VSIGMADRDRNPLVGVVYNPFMNELYTAIRGQGAWFNDKPMRVRATDELSKSVLATGFPYDLSSPETNNLKEWAALSTRTRATRRFGSAALDLCWVAAGRLDGFWERLLNPWDVMAGLLCVLEAGGIVTDYAGDQCPQKHDKGPYIASNGRIHQAIMDVIRNA
jgi:myo-inositol-1(or 4)-monophosphatase